MNIKPSRFWSIALVCTCFRRRVPSNHMLGISVEDRKCHFGIYRGGIDGQFKQEQRSTLADLWYVYLIESTDSSVLGWESWLDVRQAPNVFLINGCKSNLSNSLFKNVQHIRNPQYNSCSGTRLVMSDKKLKKISIWCNCDSDFETEAYIIVGVCVPMYLFVSLFYEPIVLYWESSVECLCEYCRFDTCMNTIKYCQTLVTFG